MPSSNFIQAATAQETEAVLLTLLTIYVDDEPELYLVDDKQSITSNGHVHYPCSFKAILPDQSSDGNKICKLQIDNSDLAIYKTIKSAIGHKITCDVGVILSTSPSVYEQGPFNFILRNIIANVSTITGDLYDMYIQDRKLTNIKYTPDTFPGLFF